ncbi:MAG: TolC family protein [Gemmataceae bacterium]|nr:TolC family protein [Gemmataceae bacterium]
MVCSKSKRALWLVCLLVVARPAGAAEPVKEREEGIPSPSPAAAPSSLTLGDLEAMALRGNPTLVQAAAQIDVSRAKALQAGLYPNPTIGYQAELIGVPGPAGKSTPGEFQGGFIRQEIVTAGKLRLSRAKYQQEALAAEIQATAQQLRVINDIHIAFYEVLTAQRLIENHRELVKNAQDAVKTTEQLVNVGQGNEPDLLQARVEANRERVALAAVEQRYRRSREHLATMIGAPELPPCPLAGQLEPDGPPLEWEKELCRLLQESPEIQFAQAEVVRDEITVKREKVEPIPNIVVQGGPGYNFENPGPNPQWNAQVSIRVPLFDRNQGTIKQAKADLVRAHAEVARLELILRRRLADAFSRYETARASVEDFRERSLPTSRKAYELYQEYFQKRRAAWPQVLVAQRTYFQFSDDYANALLDLRRAETEIKGLLLVGGLNVPPGPTPQGHLEASPKPR